METLTAELVHGSTDVCGAFLRPFARTRCHPPSAWHAPGDCLLPSGSLGMLRTSLGCDTLKTDSWAPSCVPPPTVPSFPSCRPHRTKLLPRASSRRAEHAPLSLTSFGGCSEASTKSPCHLPHVSLPNHREVGTVSIFVRPTHSGSRSHCAGSVPTLAAVAFPRHRVCPYNPQRKVLHLLLRSTVAQVRDTVLVGRVEVVYACPPLSFSPAPRNPFHSSDPADPELL